MVIRLSGVVSESIVDGPGLRFAIFTQGCPHHCKGCHNPETHDFDGGRLADTDLIIKKIKENPLLSGVTFSGGEPFCQPEPLADMAVKLKKDGYHLLAFTGYRFEKLLEMSEENQSIKTLLKNLDIIIDGKFELDKRSLDLTFKGSSNQRTIDVAQSLEAGKVIEFEI